MPWFAVDDKLHDHRKSRKAGVAAMGLWSLAGSWCGDHLTDGFVPEDILDRWSDEEHDAADLAARLVAAGYWRKDRENGERGWRFHQWDHFQPTRAEVMAEHAKKVEAGKKGGIASGVARRRSKGEAGASGVLEQVVDESLNPLPSPPVKRSPNPADAGGCAAHGTKVKNCRGCGTNPRAVRADAGRRKWGPWCGACDESSRMFDNDEGKAEKCSCRNGVGEVA